MLLSGTAANGNSPYIQSWPSNMPHYAFSIAGGNLSVVTGNTYLTGSPATYLLTGANNGNLTAALVSAAAANTAPTAPALIPYTGPATCVGVA